MRHLHWAPGRCEDAGKTGLMAVHGRRPCRGREEAGTRAKQQAKEGRQGEGHSRGGWPAEGKREREREAVGLDWEARVQRGSAMEQGDGEAAVGAGCEQDQVGTWTMGWGRAQDPLGDRLARNPNFGRSWTRTQAFRRDSSLRGWTRTGGCTFPLCRSKVTEWG